MQWNLADNFADTVLSQVTGYQTLQEMQAAFEASSRALLDNLADADKQHQDKVADLLNKTGLDVDNMEDKVNDNLDKIQDGIEDTADSVSDMSDEFVDALDKTITEAEQFEDVWDNVISAVIAKNNELISSISSMLDYYKRLTSAAIEAAAAMGVASMVVGQYYMTQINAELGAISDGITQIQDFQDNEYRSRVFSLVAHVKKIADFQTEILENDELRLSKISQLDSLEEECTQLLGQANLTLTGFAKKSDFDYEGYEKALGHAQDWFMYQQSLLDVLYKISDLRYTLHLGAVSREQCIALLPTYSKQVSDTQARLTAWHESTAERLGIEVEESRRKRAGIDGVIHFIPGLFNDDLNCREIEEKTAKMIAAQKIGHDISPKIDKSELYAEDVQLISKDGKIYYLPESKAQ